MAYNDEIQARPVKPGRFLTCAQFAWFNFDREFEHYDLADTMHILCPPREWNGDTTLGGFCLNVTPDDPFPELTSETVYPAWRKQVEKLRQLGRPFDFFGIFDGGKLPDGPGYYAAQCMMPPEDYEHMMGRVGDLFIGWDMGEWDGLYGRDVVFYWKPEEYPKTRKEAYERFMGYLHKLHGCVYRNACTIVGCTFPHYFHELPIRMLGAEVGQGLLNYQVYTSFLRGAKRQYGLESKIITSVFDRWGYTCYSKEIRPYTMADEHGGKIVFRADAVSGHSIGLHQAMWITGYYAGAAIMGLDGAYYTDEFDERGVRKLSPLGRKWMEFREWSRNPPLRGQQVRPLALLLDYHAGWTPPRHLYSMKHNVVWHSLPYGPSDYGMDRAYDFFYPGYTDSGFYRDERGFITPTPCGDSVDVLLSDATVEALGAYPVVWYLFDETPSEQVMACLRDYVDKGGHLIASGTPLAAMAQAWFGMVIPGEAKQAVHAVWSADQEQVREGHFTIRQLPVDGAWSVHAVTEVGDPVIASRGMGRGRITFLAADHGLTDKLVALGLDMNPRWNYTPEAPRELLHCVQRYLKGCVREYLPVVVDEPGVYYAVNVLADGRHVVCLYNPGHEPWRGALRIKGPRASIRELAGCWSSGVLQDAGVTLPANQTTVLEVLP